MMNELDNVQIKDSTDLVAGIQGWIERAVQRCSQRCPRFSTCPWAAAGEPCAVEQTTFKVLMSGYMERFHIDPNNVQMRDLTTLRFIYNAIVAAILQDRSAAELARDGINLTETEFVPVGKGEVEEVKRNVLNPAMIAYERLSKLLVQIHKLLPEETNVDDNTLAVLAERVSKTLERLKRDGT